MNRVFPKGLLTDRQKLVFHLNEEEGLGPKKIAERLGINRSAAVLALGEARKRVRDYEKNGENCTFLVPARLRDFLEMAELMKPGALRAAIESGSLHWSEERNRLEWKDYKPKPYPAEDEDDDEDNEFNFSQLLQEMPPWASDFMKLPDLDESTPESEETELDARRAEWRKQYSPRNLGWKSWQQLNELAGLPVPKRAGESDEERKVRSASELTDEELLHELERRVHLKHLLTNTKPGSKR